MIKVIKGFMGKIKESKMKQFLFCIISCACLFIVYTMLMSKLVEYNHKQFAVKNDDCSSVFQIEQVDMVDDIITLKGWAFKEGVEAKEKDFEIVLSEIDTGEKYFAEMQYVQRSDVNAYFSAECDYTNSGFLALFKKEEINLQNKKYEILVYEIEDSIAYKTGMYLEEDCIKFDEVHLVLDEEETILENIINRGVLRVNRPDLGLYVYQYEGDLYWIADKNYEFDPNASTSMVYMVYTSKNEYLPEKSVVNGWDCDRRNFHFEVCEVEIDTNDYRVAKVEMPKEYPIVKIVIGYYTTQWVWQQSFRPYYSFAE